MAIYRLVGEFAIARGDIAAACVAHRQTSSRNQFNAHERQFLAAHDPGQIASAGAARQQIRLAFAFETTHFAMHDEQGRLYLKCRPVGQGPRAGKGIGVLKQWRFDSRERADLKS